jgi:hypothetical protein
MTPIHDFNTKWEHIVNEVNKTEIPVECLKKVIIRLHGNKSKTINLQVLRRQGLDFVEIETLVSRTIAHLDDQVRDVEFVVDINAVAEIIQPETDRFLKKI